MTCIGSHGPIFTEIGSNFFSDLDKHRLYGNWRTAMSCLVTSVRSDIVSASFVSFTLMTADPTITQFFICKLDYKDC